MPFTVSRLDLPDVMLVETTAFADTRGFFAELYKQSDFFELGITTAFVQDNLSHSTRGVLRGLHYQKRPAAQGKLVSVIRGEIFDVAVDIRQGSPTYGRWVAIILSDQDHYQLYVPEGFAHGFCVLSAQADVIYKVTAEYAPALERGIRWDDPYLQIAWPLQTPVLTPKDAAWPRLQDADHNFVYREGTPQ